MDILDTPYEKNDLIWAKVENYPWWPAKIIEICQHKGALFFKVNFFNDPTYCYLKQYEIIPYEEFKEELNSSILVNRQLQKAINLAKNVFQRRKLLEEKRKNSNEEKITASKQISQKQTQITEQNQEKSEYFDQSTICVDLQTDNSNIQLVQNQKNRQIENLLQKYKLHNIPQLIIQEQINTVVISIEENNQAVQQQSADQNIELFNPRKVENVKGPTKKVKQVKRKFISKKRKNASKTSQQKKMQFMKAFCKGLIQNEIDSYISRQLTIKVCSKIQEKQAYFIKYPCTQIKNEAIYVNLLKSLSSLDKNLEYDQKLLAVFHRVDMQLGNLFGHLLKEDEERSKITQIQTQGLVYTAL